METIESFLLSHSVLSLRPSPPSCLLFPPPFSSYHLSSVHSFSYIHNYRRAFLLSLPFTLSFFLPPSPPHSPLLSLPLEIYWGDMDHEIKILVSDITEYFQFSGKKE